MPDVGNLDENLEVSLCIFIIAKVGNFFININYNKSNDLYR
jgi:hypothetical protein